MKEMDGGFCKLVRTLLGHRSPQDVEFLMEWLES